MWITLHNENNTKSYTMREALDSDKKETHIWLHNEEGEGGQFNINDIAQILYNALDKYFKEHY